MNTIKSTTRTGLLVKYSVQIQNLTLIEVYITCRYYLLRPYLLSDCIKHFRNYFFNLPSIPVKYHHDFCFTDEELHSTCLKSHSLEDGTRIQTQVSLT